jgi:hypothetical protein
MPQKAFVSLPDLPPEPPSDNRGTGSNRALATGESPSRNSETIIPEVNSGNPLVARYLVMKEASNEFLTGIWRQHHLQDIAVIAREKLPFARYIRIGVRKEWKASWVNPENILVNRYYCIPVISYEFNRESKTWTELTRYEEEIVRAIRGKVPGIITSNDIIVSPKSV